MTIAEKVFHFLFAFDFFNLDEKKEAEREKKTFLFHFSATYHAFVVLVEGKEGKYDNFFYEMEIKMNFFCALSLKFLNFQWNCQFSYFIVAMMLEEVELALRSFLVCN